MAVLQILGRIHNFKLGGVLKKIAPSGGRRTNCWGISCEKSRFYAKKILFLPILGGGGGGVPGAWIRLWILHRLPTTKEIRYEVETVWFNHRCEELILCLSNYFKENQVEKVCFWRHSGFWSDEYNQRVFLPDGVHLNNMHIYPKYYQSLRAAIVSLSKN